MGNQLVGIAPSQIFPVEHYLTDHVEFKFHSSLGSTRFLKVARADSQEGDIVVKVFAIHDPSLPLGPYKDRLEEIRVKLSSAVNCLPFRRIHVNDKAGLIMRQYIKYSLYDRISTRPFLINIEKKWITFQVLCALLQCHKVGVCHGDIKLENVMVTSWNWVLLVDYASFKPTFLPEDNPADYSYFFDTSRRRICYIAPERFIKTLSSENSSMFNETPCNSGELKPAMDIFSAGCALLELWNEGTPPFELSQLLAYRTGEYNPQKHLDSLEDPALKSLLSSMIQRDPAQRLSAELYLSQERGRIFPEYFYSFLQPYMLIFSTSPILSYDEKISRLKNDIGNIFKFLGPSNEDKEKFDDEKDIRNEDKDNGLVIITSLVTSCIRGLHDCLSKLNALDILLELAKHANGETILDRILPHVLYLAKDQTARVKISAIDVCTECLELVKKVPRSDANIFPEYILPGLAPLATDLSTCVRMAYAKHIATLAEISVRYLEQSQMDSSEEYHKHKEGPRLNYEIELQTLHEMVQITVNALLTDSQSVVKQTLMDHSITKLCVFFGKQKANDVIVSHIITFLNDKDDKELRSTFFDCIVGVAAYIGCHCSPILTPLLLQGLTDCYEFVTVKALNAMASISQLGLISKQALYELVYECSSFLVHPNLWIRQGVVGFIGEVADTLTVLDIQVKLMPHLTMYMKHSLMQIEKPDLFLDALVNPVPRSVYDNVIMYSDIDMLIDTLHARKRARDAIRLGRVPGNELNVEIHQSLKSLFRRLEANGMSESVEEYLLKMSNHLKKIHKHKTSADAKHNKQSEGKIEMTMNDVKCQIYNLSEPRSKVDFMVHSRQSESSGGPQSRTISSRPSSPVSDVHLPFSEPGSASSVHEKSYIQYRTSNCSMDLTHLIAQQRDLYVEAVRSKEWAEQAAWQPRLPPPGWRLRGTLVAHVHEHRSVITKLAPLPETPLFASASTDGYIRIWDVAKMEGKNIANRSKQSFKVPGNTGIWSLAACGNGQVAAATQDGSIHILRLDPASSKMSVLHTKQICPNEDGDVMDVQYMESGPQSVLIYATLFGSIVAWDLRSPTCAWRLENGVKQGVLTSFCLDAHNNWLTLGTSGGYHKLWDLRFRLPVLSFEHPNCTRIRKLVSHPTEHSWIFSSAQGNNEITIWNLETGYRQKVLWGSNSPPLSKTQISNHAVTAMHAGCIDRSGFLIAGGTDQRLRFWDLEHPADSYLAIHAPNDPLTGCNVSYQTRVVDGTCVVQEAYEPSSNRNAGKGDELPRAGPEPPSAGHRDVISDIALCKATQCFLVTASRDGVIKVWK